MTQLFFPAEPCYSDTKSPVTDRDLHYAGKWGHGFVEELDTGDRKWIPAVAGSEAFCRYAELRQQLLAVRKAHDGCYSEDEEPLIEEMDKIYSNMTEQELDFWKRAFWPAQNQGQTHDGSQ